MILCVIFLFIYSIKYLSTKICRFLQILHPATTIQQNDIILKFILIHCNCNQLYSLLKHEHFSTVAYFSPIYLPRSKAVFPFLKSSLLCFPRLPWSSFFPFILILASQTLFVCPLFVLCTLVYRLHSQIISYVFIRKSICFGYRFMRLRHYFISSACILLFCCLVIIHVSSNRGLYIIL